MEIHVRGGRLRPEQQRHENQRPEGDHCGGGWGGGGKRAARGPRGAYPDRSRESREPSSGNIPICAAFAIV